MRPSLLVVTGLQREAAIARCDGVETVCSGGDPAPLRILLAARAPDGHWGVISFGIAGGLDPALQPGAIVLASAIVTDDARLDVHAGLNVALRAQFAARNINITNAAIAGVDAAVMNTADKADLRARTHASAADMESHVAALWAQNYGLPFAAIRVVSDPAHRALPPLAATALKPDGTVDLPRVLRGLARQPGQIGALIHAGRDAKIAFAALGRCGGLAGPLFGLRLADV